MELERLFRRIELVSAGEIKAAAEGSGIGENLLLDVREPIEYERGHIPGSLHIPLSQLADRLGELDPERPVVTY